MKDSQYYTLLSYLTAIGALIISNINIKIFLLIIAVLQMIFAIISILKEQ